MTEYRKRKSRIERNKEITEKRKSKKDNKRAE
jgi:hypothetical protein